MIASLNQRLFDHRRSPLLIDNLPNFSFVFFDTHIDIPICGEKEILPLKGTYYIFHSEENLKSAMKRLQRNNKKVLKVLVSGSQPYVNDLNFKKKKINNCTLENMHMFVFICSKTYTSYKFMLSSCPRTCTDTCSVQCTYVHVLHVHGNVHVHELLTVIFFWGGRCNEYGIMFIASFGAVTRPSRELIITSTFFGDQ
jgi:hypothetical protein